MFLYGLAQLGTGLCCSGTRRRAAGRDWAGCYFPFMGSWICKLLAILSLLAVAEYPPPLCSPPIIVTALFSRMRFPVSFMPVLLGTRIMHSLASGILNSVSLRNVQFIYKAMHCLCHKMSLITRQEYGFRSICLALCRYGSLRKGSYYLVRISLGWFYPGIIPWSCFWLTVRKVGNDWGHGLDEVTVIAKCELESLSFICHW